MQKADGDHLRDDDGRADPHGGAEPAWCVFTEWVHSFQVQGSGFKGREGFSRLITIPARVDGLTGGVEAPPAGEAYIIQRVTENYLGSTTTLTSSWFYPYLWAVFYDLTMLNYYHNFISGFRFRGSDVIFFIVDAVMVNPERPFDV